MFSVLGPPTACYRPNDVSASVGWELRRLRQSGVETDCKIRVYVPSGTPTLEVYGGVGASNPHILAPGWQTITSRLAKTQVASDTVGPYVRLTHQNGDVYVAWVEVDQNLPPYSGVYMPTLTPVANVTSAGNNECQFIRVGDVVTVSGKLSFTPSVANAVSQLGISLPINSNFGSDADCAGTALELSSLTLGSPVFGDATNNRAAIAVVPPDTLLRSFYFHFTYQVI